MIITPDYWYSKCPDYQEFMAKRQPGWVDLWTDYYRLRPSPPITHDGFEYQCYELDGWFYAIDATGIYRVAVTEHCME